MLNNHSSWGERRKAEIMEDSAIQNKQDECRKLDERMGKFRESMSFVASLKDLPTRRGSI